MRSVIVVLLFIFCLSVFEVSAQTDFTDFDSFMSYATSISISIQSNTIRLTKAQRAKLAAIYGIADPSGSAQLSYTNNTRLPVNLFPGEIFGGAPGTYKRVKTGIQYVTYQNFNADIKLLNLQGWFNLKLSGINITLAESDAKVSLKELHENVASVYFNIVALQEQLKATHENLKAADTLYRISFNRNELGNANQQEVNDSRVNQLTLQEKAKQLQFQIEQQYVALKILADIPEEAAIQINQSVLFNTYSEPPEVGTNSLAFNHTLYKEQYSKVNHKQSLNAMMPTLSFFASQTNQQYNTRSTPFDSNVDWIPSSYIGLRLLLTIPSASSISKTSQARYDYLLAQNDSRQARIKIELDRTNLQLDYAKAVSQSKANKEIYQLRKDSYQKNVMNYEEGIIRLDQTIDSFNDLVNSQYDLISSAIDILLAAARIDIYNKIN